MRKKYGDVIGITMGSLPAVVICGYDVIKEALTTKGDDFSGRPAFTSGLLINGGQSLAFGVFNEAWKRQRKIARNVLHAYTSASKVPIEDIVHTEVDTVVRELMTEAETSRGVVEPCGTLRVAASSVMYQLCYGHYLHLRENTQFTQLLKSENRLQELLTAGSALDVMPWLRFLHGRRTNPPIPGCNRRVLHPPPQEGPRARRDLR